MSVGLRRGFLAVVPPPSVLRWTESVEDSARRIGDALRWTRLDQRHLTLQFLGAVTEPTPLAESVAESVRRIPAFTVALGGAGAFPSARRASVLWLGVAQGAAELGALAAAVTDATVRVGIARDDRPYHAHLTVARAGRARDVRALVEYLGTGPAGPPFTVDRVVLFDSDTRPDGAVYTEVQRFALTAGSGSAPC